MLETMTPLQIKDLDIHLLRPFKNHPFKVVADYPMVQLKESIAAQGILSPLIVRPMENGMYEIISGHRRKAAAEQLGLKKVPAIIRELSYDDAVLIMVDANLQRELISPSEKAFAYKMKYEAMRRTVGKKKAKDDECSKELIGKRTVKILEEESPDSAKQIQRYLRITKLVPEFLEKLDDGMISFNPAFEISFLPPKEQRMLIDAMDYAQAAPSISQAQRIKKLSREGRLTENKMQDILSEVKKGDLERVSFKKSQLKKFFPKEWTTNQMKREIINILNNYVEQKFESNDNGGNAYV